MSEEITAQIPGTTYSIKFGFEGKYYALFLCRGFKEFKTMKLNILRGTSLHELPEEVENGLKNLLVSEEVFLSPVIVKNVTNNLLEQLPENGQIKADDAKQKQFVKTDISVSSLISKSDERAGKKSIIEHAPRDKPKFDATADSLGRIDLKKPKQLPEKIIKREVTPVEEHKPIKKSEEKTPMPVMKPMEITSEVKKEDYNHLDDKVTTLSNEVQSLHKILDKNNQDIEFLKEQIDTIKQEATAPQETDVFIEETKEIELEIKEPTDEQELITEELIEPEESTADEESITETTTVEEIDLDSFETDESSNEDL